MPVIHAMRSIYESLPAPVKTVAGAVARSLPVRLRYGQAFVDELRAIQRTERDGEAQSLLQRERLRAVLEACESSPFWKRRLRGVRSSVLADPLQALAALEPISKDTLRDHMDEMRSARWSARNSKLVTTGGTTGAQVGLWLEKDASVRDWAHVVASWGRVGFQLDEPRVVLRGVHHADARGRKAIFYEPIRRELYISPFDIDEEHLPAMRQAIEALGARFIHGYPSAVETLVRGYLARGWQLPRIRAVLAVSENLYDGQRMFLEEALGTRVFSIYGLSERCCFASECEASAELHLHEIYGVVELLGEDGTAIDEPGVMGEIVATGLLSTTMPLVRYRTGDYAMWAEGPCSCGRVGRRLVRVEGRRRQEFLVGATGTPISMTALNVHSPALLAVERYRFVQDRPGTAVLQIQPGPTYREEDGLAILEEFKRKVEGQIELSLAVVDSIPLSPRGKQLFIDQRIPRDELPVHWS